MAGQPAGDNPHQVVLDDVAKMLQEAEVRHTAHINQVAADQAKAAAATFAEQFKTILPPPALPTDGDMEEDESADKRAGGAATTPAAAAPAVVSPTAHNPWQRLGSLKAS